MSSTTAAPPRPGPPAAGPSRRRTRPARLLAAGAVLSAALLLVAVAGLALDDRVVTGAPAWLKPAKFAASITVYLLTLRWVLTQVRGCDLAVAVVSAVPAVVLVVELAYITAQVVRGTTSHFNESTPLDAALFAAMGALVSLLFLTTTATAVLVLRRRDLDAGTAAGIGWGLGVSLLGMAEAALMVANRAWDATGGHTVGAPDGGAGMVLTGWSLAHGDLRIAHFAGLHALQVLPLLAWLLARRTGLDQRTRARLVAVAGCAHGAAVVLLAWQALRGQALLRPDATTLLAVAGVALLVAGAVAGVLRASRRADAAPPPS